MSSRWRRFELLLPVRFNDGQDVPPEWLAEAVLEMLVPKLRLGNPVREAPASRLHHQARITSIKPSCPA